MRKKALSLLLALVLCLGLLPTAVFAAEGGGETPDTSTTEPGETTTEPEPEPDPEPEDTAPETITVNFDSHGGSSVGPRTYTIGEPYGDLPTPTWEGYKFNGWYDESGLYLITRHDNVTAKYDTLHAGWVVAKTIYVGFDSQGGGNIPARTYYDYESYGDLPTPTREGYIFDGWSLWASSPFRVKEEDTVKFFHHTLYAQWVAEAPPEFEIENGVLKKYNGPGGNVVIPDGVTSIGQSAFSPCSTLTSVVIPDGVTSIGGAAFYQCRNLRSVDIPSSVTAIEGNAFSMCESLKQITIPDGVRTIGGEVFFRSGLTSVTIPDSVTEVGFGTFSDCTSLEEATLGSGLNQLSMHMFYGCSALKTLTLPATITSLGDSLIGCNNMTDIYYGGSQRLRDPNLFLSGNKITVHYSDGTTNSGAEPSKPVSVTVSFDSNGGNSVSDKTVTVGEKYGSLPTPTREGYTFDGWYTSSTGGSEVTASTTVTNESDHTLYAHWIEANGKLTVSPGKVSFDSAEEGYAQPAAQTVTVKNTGSASLTLTQPSASSFELGSLSRTSLSANASATFTVRPKAGLKVGTYSETITVKSADGKAAASVPVSFTVEAEEAVPPASGFTDISAGAYYYDAVLWAVEKGVTSGSSATTFSPDATCTRAQVVTFLHRAKGSPEVQAENPFQDVAAGSFYLNPVLWAVENKITGGTGAATFSPDAPCTRAQVVTFLWNAAGRPEPKDSASKFTDVQDPSAYYYKAVLWAVENGITSGTSATAFSPNATCNRGQVVTFLHRAYK